MYLELEPEIEAALAEKSSALGVTPAQLSVKVLQEYAQIEPRDRMSDQERKQFVERWSARMKANHPNYESQDPYAQDWHAIKAEGRKY